MCRPTAPGRRALRTARRREDMQETIRRGRLFWSLVQWDTRIARMARRLSAPEGRDPRDPQRIVEATRTLVAEGYRFPPDVAAWRARRGLSIPDAAHPVIIPGEY